MNRPAMKADGRRDVPRVICVTGIDGCGKTTVVEWLRTRLREEGYRADVLWLRFNHVFTRPLLAICRLVGLTRYETVGDVRVGYHEFHRSRVVSWLFVLLQYLDAARVRWLRIAPRLRDETRVVILDRFVHDILVDIMVDTGITDLDRKFLGRALLRLLPPGTLVLPLARDAGQLLEARPESHVDRNFPVRLRLYEATRARLSLVELHNDGTLEQLLAQVAKRVGITP